MPRKRNYVGVKVDETGTCHERFLSETTPTTESHGKTYGSVMGPFPTKWGALFYVHYGQGNPHTMTTTDCERLATVNREQLHGKPDRRFFSVP